jgi:tripartite-type tricarboxylate transporter receptor subunit TctC
MTQVTGQQMRVLAVTGDKRLGILPDVPTFKERGLDITLSLWRGIATPKGTPPAVIARLERAFTGAAQSAEFREFSTKLGAAVEIRSASEFDAFIAREDTELAGLMEQIGLKKQ